MRTPQIKVRLLFCLMAHVALLLILALYLQSSLLSVTRYMPLANDREMELESLASIYLQATVMQGQLRSFHQSGSLSDLTLWGNERLILWERIRGLEALKMVPSPAELNRRNVLLKWLHEIADPVQEDLRTGVLVEGGDRGLVTSAFLQQSANLLQELDEETQIVRDEVVQALTGLQGEEANEASDRVKLMWLLVGGVTFFTIVIQLAVSNSIIRPIQQLGAAVQRLQKGDVRARARLRSGDEIQALGNTFNAMAESIQENREELEQMNISLEARVTEKTQELEEKNQRLHEASRLKDQFLATLSHELRTPLAPILSCAHLLESTGALGEEDQRFVRVIERNARGLSRMIDELLDLSATMNQKLFLVLESTEMNVWCQSLLDSFRPTWESKGLKLFFTPAPTLVELPIDPVRLAQVVTNLVGNAIKYTDSPGSIFVTLSQQQNRFLLSVRDTGAGLSEEDQERVFEMFHQARTARTSGLGGLGVGLTVARALTELHGGHLVAFSAGLGKGSTFTVSLPLQVPVSGLERAPKGGLNRLTGPVPLPTKDKMILRGVKVLVVEDTLDSLDSLQRILQRRGCLVYRAASAEEGWMLALNEKPEVILSDIGLPGLSGLDLIRQVRAVPALRNVFALALSGLGREEDSRAGIEAGFDAYLLKPVEIALLDRALVEHFQKAGRTIIAEAG